MRSGWHRRVRLGIVGLLAAGAVTACSVPSSGPPIVDGKVRPGSDNAGTVQGLAPPRPDEYHTDQVGEFLTGYLSVAVTAAANSEDIVGDIAHFTKANALPKVSTDEITIVHQVTEWSDLSAPTVRAKFIVIGVFNPGSGVLDPAPNSTAFLVTFKVATISSADAPQHLRLDGPPSNTPTLVSTDDAFLKAYASHTIYFWNTARTALVPDVRYLPSGGRLSTIRQATTIVSWVLAGVPSDWLGSAVAPLVSTQLSSPLVTVASKPAPEHFVINMSASARGLGKFDQLSAQLRWSLGNITTPQTRPPSPVELQIEKQTQLIDAGVNYRDKGLNLAAIRDTPHRYGIVDQKVRALDPGADKTAAAVLDSPLNAAAVSGAVSADGLDAAIVRQAADGQHLWIRRASDGRKTDFQQVTDAKLTGSTLTRPQWVSSPAGYLMIGVKGKLYRIDAKNKVQAVDVPTGFDDITAFAVGIDGQRVAFVANGGRLYLSVLTGGDAPSLTKPNPINTNVSLSAVTGVAWQATDHLFVAGVHAGNGRVIVENVDGSGQTQLSRNDYAAGPVTRIAGFSLDPLSPTQTGQVMFQVGNLGYAPSQVDRGVYAPLEFGDPKKNVTSPFFQD